MMNFEEMSHQTDAQLFAPDYGVDELGLDMPGASSEVKACWKMSEGTVTFQVHGGTPSRG